MKPKNTENKLTTTTILSLKNTGTLLTQARQRRGFSLVELSHRAGVDRRTLSQLEAGHPGVSIGTFFQVLSLLNLRGIEECLKPENDIETIALNIRKIRKHQKLTQKISDREVDF